MCRSVDRRIADLRRRSAPGSMPRAKTYPGLTGRFAAARISPRRISIRSIRLASNESWPEIRAANLATSLFWPAACRANASSEKQPSTRHRARTAPDARSWRQATRQSPAVINLQRADQRRTAAPAFSPNGNSAPVRCPKGLTCPCRAGTLIAARKRQEFAGLYSETSSMGELPVAAARSKPPRNRAVRAVSRRQFRASMPEAKTRQSRFPQRTGPLNWRKMHRPRSGCEVPPKHRETARP